MSEASYKIVVRARELGMKVEWDIDEDPGYPVEDDEEALWARVGHPVTGETLASLGSVIVKAPSFIRGVAQDIHLLEVENDLLYEAMGEWQAEHDREVTEEAESIGSRATYAG